MEVVCYVLGVDRPRCSSLYSAPHHSGIVGVAGDALDSPSDRSEGSLKILEIVRYACCSTIIDSNRYGGVGIEDCPACSWVGCNIGCTYNNMYNAGKPAEIDLFAWSVMRTTAFE